jgi:acetoin:2,6-dichlorophenolindophenol oxidoreductase subunit alpha
VREWLERDPVPRYRARLVADGIEQEELAAIETAAERDVEEATEFAKNGEVPGEALLLQDVWSDGGWEWRN